MTICSHIAPRLAGAPHLLIWCAALCVITSAAGDATVAAPDPPAVSCPATPPVTCAAEPATLVQAQQSLNTGSYASALAQARCLLNTPALPRDQTIAALQILGSAATRTGDYGQALSALQQAQAAAANDPRNLGKALLYLGTLHERQKQQEKAQAYYQEALRNFRSEDPEERAETWFKIGDLAVDRARFNEGKAAYQNALDAAKAANSPLTQARAEVYLAYADRTLGNFEQAWRDADEARNIVGRTQGLDPAQTAVVMALSYNHSGWIKRETAVRENDHNLARTLLREALELEQEAQRRLQPPGASAPYDYRRLGYILRAMSKFHVDLADYDQADRRAHLQDAFDDAQEALHVGEVMGDVEWQGLALHRLAEVSAMRYEYDNAQRQLERAVSIWQCLKDRESLGWAYFLLAQRVAAPRKDYATAAGFYRQALGEFESVQDADASIDTLLAMGRLAEDRGDVQGAKVSYLRAIEILEKARAGLPNDNDRLMFFARRTKPYEALISLLRGPADRQSQADDIEQALRASECARARSILDHMVPALDAASRPFQMACAAEAAANRFLPVDRQQLRPNEVLFEYFIGEQRSYLFVVARDLAPKAIVLDAKATKKAIATTIEEFRKPFDDLKKRRQSGIPIRSLSLTDGASFNIDAAHELYELLIRPGEQYLTPETRQLTVVPHGPLFFLPFEALIENAPPTGDFPARLRHSRFALDALPPVAYAFSIKTLPTDEGRRTADRSLAAFVDPVTRYGDVRYPVDASSLERQHVPVVRFSREQATERRFQDEAGRYGALDLEVHAVFDEEAPDKSGLWLSKPGNPAGINVTPEAISNLNLHARLVTIRACEVGMGPVLDGEGVTGITRAFKHAGASNLLLSLWMVDDRSSSNLFSSFYDRPGGDTYPAALRQAKLGLLHPGLLAGLLGPHWEHPFFWAPFVLVF